MSDGCAGRDPYDATHIVIEIEEVLGATAPDQTIIATYCAGLSHFDHAVLPALQREGEGRVSVLMDETTLEAAFAEASATFAPGVRYRLLPVRPPASHAFHPKLYLLMGPSAATLLVGSANLTLFGLRENLEVIEPFSLSEESTSDLPVFRDALDFLERLSAVDGTLASSLAGDLSAARGRLARWERRQAASGETPREATHKTTRETPPPPVRLLHSIDRSLLDQLSEALPAEGVRRVTCIAPFYDGHGRFLLEMARAFPAAQLRVVRPQREREDLDGRALAPLAERLTVERLLRVAGQRRRLHAKLYLIEADGGFWSVAGSANATAAAWLHPALDVARPGNVELVVLRQHPDVRPFEELLAALETEPVSLDSLRFDPALFEAEGEVDRRLSLARATERSPGIHALLRARSAEEEAWLRGAALTARVSGRVGVAEGAAHVEVADETPEGRAEEKPDETTPSEDPAESSRREDEATEGATTLSAAPPASTPGLLHLRAKLDLGALAGDDQPLALHVTALGEDGVRREGRIWIERPHLLGLSSRERRFQAALSRLERSRQLGEEEVRSVSDALVDYLRGLGQSIEIPIAPPHTAPPGGGGGGENFPAGGDETHEEDPGRRPTEPFTLSADSMDPHRSGGGGHLHSLIRRAARLLETVLGTSLELDETDEGEDEGDGQGGGREAPGGTDAAPSAPLPLRLFDAVHKALIGPLDEALARDTDPVRTPHLLPAVETAGWLLFHLHTQAVLGTQRAETAGEQNAYRGQAQRFARALYDLLAHSFDIGGAEHGHARGAFMRLWFTNRTEAARGMEGQQWTGILALIAAAGVLNQTSTQAVAGTVAGVRLLGAPPTPTALEQGALPDRLEAVAERSGGAVSETELRAALESLGRTELPILRMARWWAPVFRLARRETPPPEDRAADERRVREQAPELLRLIEQLRSRGRDAIRPITRLNSTACCSECMTALPLHDLQRLGSAERPYVRCQTCGLVVAPWDPASPATHEVFSALDTLEVRS